MIPAAVTDASSARCNVRHRYVISHAQHPVTSFSAARTAVHQTETPPPGLQVPVISDDEAPPTSPRRRRRVGSSSLRQRRLRLKSATKSD